MQEMENKILNEGQVLPGGILKVGNFLNQQIDTAFLGEIGKEIAGTDGLLFAIAFAEAAHILLQGIVLGCEAGAAAAA